MESVYEQDFIEDSYGFRPARSCHNALKALSEAVENNPTNHIVEADIKGFTIQGIIVDLLSIIFVNDN